MTVILHEAAIERLLTTNPGIARLVEERAQAITTSVQQSVRGYFHSAPSLTVDQDVGYEMKGTEAVIGIRNAGEKARRIAGNPDLLPKWLQSALEAARV